MRGSTPAPHVLIMMIEEMTTPAETLSLLSSMYLCKPSREALESWKTALSGESVLFLDELKKAVKGIDMTSDAVLEGLLWEYTRLFIGPYKLPCPPWESVYTSPKRLMMQDSADQIRVLYAEAGLAINTNDIMPDHIGVELNFLAVLLRRVQSETNNKEEEMGRTGKLLNEHLIKWVPQFTRDMENAAETPFFKALARATRQIMEVIGR